MNTNWESERLQYCKGWHTWNNESVLSYIRPLDGMGLRFCVKDYKSAAFLSDVLIGEDQAEVIPRAHAYDDSFTELSISWQDNHFEVMSAVYNGDLYLLVRSHDSRLKPSSLILQGLSLYNSGAVIRKEKSCLVLENREQCIRVFCTASENSELYVPLYTPYLSVTLQGEIGFSTGSEKSLDEIREIIESKREEHAKAAEKYADQAELYKAMQICQAWDTIYDPAIKSPMTTVSRIWNKNWGGYVLFCWDTYFGALMQSLDNKVLAYSNVFAITNSITDKGFVPNYACQDGFKSFDRSQPPVGSMVCMEIYRRYQEKWFLSEVFEKLLGWNRWFFDNRQTPNGLLTWGSDPYEKFWDHRLESDGIGDWQGASYESGLDNSPMYEAIPFDKENHIYCLDDVGLSGLYLQDCYSLTEMAEILGDHEVVAELSERIRWMEEKLQELWDEKTGLYLNRRTDTGAFEYRLSPFHFHALYSKRVTADRIERMIREHMLNPEEFLTPYPLPSIAKNDPSYVKQTYWQGRVWAPMNYLVFAALKKAEERIGEEAVMNEESGNAETKVENPEGYETSLKAIREAETVIRERSAKLILKEWLECGHVHENYDPENGEGCNNERSDRFYHWGGLLSYLSFM